MYKFLFILKIGLLTTLLSFFVAACSEDNEDAVTETGMVIPEITVTCSVATDAECANAANNGDAMYLIWTTDTCAGFTGNAINALADLTGTCDGTTCDAASSGSWLQEVDNADVPVTTIPATATTAGAWLNLIDNGGTDSDGPGTGDIFCCAENQTGNATLTDSNCNTVP